MANPKLRVRASGLGGSGYVLPARVGDPFKIVKNADGEPIKARLDSEGKTTVYGGVTTILRQHEKDNLIQWAVNLTVKWASDNAALLLSKSDADVMRWGKYRHNDVRDERAEIGTHIHEYIEAELNEEWLLPELTEEEASAVNQWHRFTNEHEVGAQLTEVTLWGDGYAGTADLLGLVDGKMTLSDTKTSKGTYWSHEMQISALARANFMLIEGEDGFWEEVDIPKIEQYGILHLRPDYYDPLKETWTDAFYNWILIDPDEIDMHYTAFCGLRDVANMQYAIKQHRKAKEKTSGTD